MKFAIKSIRTQLFIAFFSCLFWQANAFANVCSEGTGIPPFLAAGADPNLLMVIDNSGSMLDMAYTPDNSNSCFDDTYLMQADIDTYAGYYESEEWYQWVDFNDSAWWPATVTKSCDQKTIGAQSCPSWEPLGEYDHNELIFENGVYYRAQCADEISCTASDVNTIRSDSGVTWQRADLVKTWVTEEQYNAGDFVRRDDQLYLALEEDNINDVGEIIDPPDPANPPAVGDEVWLYWKAIAHTWGQKSSYVAGEFVTYQGMTFQATTTINPISDINPFYDGGGTLVWLRMDGHWAKVESPSCIQPNGNPDLVPSFTYTRFDADGDIETETVPEGETPDPNFGYDMMIFMYDGTTKITSANYDDTNVIADAVTCFAARGNFLNWASASKFDIQKEILTGGKYSAGYEEPLTTDPDTNVGSGGIDGPLEVGVDDDGVPYPDNRVTDDREDDRLISESRGCAGSNYIKQVRLWDPSTATGTPTGLEPPNNDSSETTMTMRVRGPLKEDWISSGEDVTRIEIMSVSGNTFDATYCESAVEAMVELAETGSGGVGFISDTDKCLTNTNKDLEFNPALNHALQYCGFSWRTNAKEVARNLNPIIGECETYYTEFAAGAIDPYDDAYVCYGIYDETYNHNDTYGDEFARTGYIGRCWQKGVGSGGTTCDNITIPNGTCLNTGAGCEFQYNHDFDDTTANILVRNKNETYTEYCTAPDDSTNPTSCSNGASWEFYTVDSATKLQCDPDDSQYSGGTDPGWSDQLYTSTDDGYEGAVDFLTTDQQAIAELSNRNAGATGLTDPAWWCIYQGMEDYCADTSVPEVIDPSDLASDSGSTYNLPATLIDSGVVAQLGTDRPLATFKGFIKYDLPEIHNSDPDKAVSLDDGDSPYRPDGPRNILFDVAEIYDLRLGVMDFNLVGSSTECEYLNNTCTTGDDGSYSVCDVDGASYNATDCEYCMASLNMDKYCPKYGDNEDGAQVITQIGKGMVTLDDNDTPSDITDDIEDWRHYVKLIKSINDSKATSWTPLAEAVYGALGYYGQNTSLRINTPNVTTRTILDTCDKVTKDDLSGDIFRVCKTTHPDYSTDDCDYCNGLADFYTNEEDPINWEDPVQYWCQENNILIITEGASTADTFDTTSFAGFQGDDDGVDGDGNDVIDSVCTGGLEGSTFLDDLTYFGRNDTVEGASDDVSTLFTKLLPKDETNPNTDFAKQPVSTYIVTTGSLDQTQTEECSPWGLMTNAASNGGTQLLYGENPQDLKARLQEAFAGIAQRASSGSAASVISSSKSGKGAVFQAVFWPAVNRSPGTFPDGTLGAIDDDPLYWTGDVHAFYIDDFGRLWDDYSRNAPTGYGERVFWSEDENGNGLLDPEDQDGVGDDGDGVLEGDRRVYLYFDGKDTRVCFVEPVAVSDTRSTCDNSLTAHVLQTNEITNANAGPMIRDFAYFLWSAAEELETITDDILENRPFATAGATAGSYPYGKWQWSGDNYRYIFTWNDLNNDGIVTSYDPTLGFADEIIPLVSRQPTGGFPDTDWTDYSVNTGNNRVGPVYLDFKVTTNDEMNELVEWIRGSDIVYEAAGVDENGNGVQDYKYRCRRYPDCIVPDPTNYEDPDMLANPEWRLGDIVHSTPKLVAQPAEAFQTIYADASYALFVKRYRFRRNVVYFGANDGLLHAINTGFPDTKNNRYWKNLDISSTGELCYYDYDGTGITDSYSPTSSNTDGSCTPTGSSVWGPDLGTELWAYLPYNLQPHMSCLADPEYDVSAHKYYVDKEPRIFDMQIFEEEAICNTNPYHEDCIHPGGWGTIVVGSMRFGGAPVTTADDPHWTDQTDPTLTDNREFVSAYFVLDVTDPERPPKLLGEYTRTTSVVEDPADTNLQTTYTNLGYTTPMPTGVAQRKDNGESNWYLILGSGPSSEVDYINPIEGENDLDGKIAYLPMSWLTGITGVKKDVGTAVAGTSTGTFSSAAEPLQPFRIPDRPVPASAADQFQEAGVIDIPTDGNNPSFTSDLASVDFSLENHLVAGVGAALETDAVYFGTVEGSLFSSVWDPVTETDITRWPSGISTQSGGGVYRLVTSYIDSVGDFIPYGNVTPPPESNRIVPPRNWTIKRLLDADRPVTGSPSLGWDGAHFWVYFGTGRFFDVQDKTDDTENYFFGLKEPMSDNCDMSWQEISWDSATWNATLSPSTAPGLVYSDRGLVRSDSVKVLESVQSRVIFPDPDGFQTVDTPIIFCEAGAPALECDLSFLNPIVSGTYNPVAGVIDPIDDLGLNPVYSYEDLRQYIAGDLRGTNVGTGDCDWDGGGSTIGIDGWFRVLNEERERVIGQSTLLGGLVTYTSYVPNDGVCDAEGESYLYGVHYQMGTAWYEYVFGLDTEGTGIRNPEGGGIVVSDKLLLGRGLSTTPSLQSGTISSADAKVFVQASTGEIIEIEQENLPISPPRSGRVFWNDDQNPMVLPE